MKHKHAETIIAWANGAEIEVRPDSVSYWLPTTTPNWHEDFEYRTAPSENKKATKWLWCNKGGLIYNNLMGEGYGSYNIKLEWSATEFEVEE